MATGTIALHRIFDAELFRALCEPVRLKIISRLMQLGRADVAAIAKGFSQDRSVISRHLHILKSTGIVVASPEGRHVFYHLDGPELANRLRQMSDEIRAAAPLCCPGIP